MPDTKQEVLEILKNDDEFDFEAIKHALTSVKSKLTVEHPTLGGPSIYVKVSKSCGEGQDGYFEILPGGMESWKRCIFKKVTMKASHINGDEEIFASHGHVINPVTGENEFIITGLGFERREP